MNILKDIAELIKLMKETVSWTVEDLEKAKNEARNSTKRYLITAGKIQKRNFHNYGKWLNTTSK